jgi:hypothetical protein
VEKAFEDGDTSLERYLAREGAARGEPEAPHLWEAGREVGEWTVTAFLARGGSAETYCARHRRLGTAAALKVLWREEAAPRARFERETAFLMENRDPAFPAFLGTGEEEGRPWMAMELLEECPLPSADAEVARYLDDVGRGVAALHARGWLHRDLKPRNILRRADGHAVLVDFGLLKPIGGEETVAAGPALSVVDGREVGVGTPGYSAPEQFAGGPATPAADVYALGMLAEECFGGKPPRAWNRIIRRATGALPRQRYAGVAEMLRAIRVRNRGRNFRRAALAVAGLPLLLALVSGARSAVVAFRAGRERRAAVERFDAEVPKEVVEGILRDMVPLPGAERLEDDVRNALGVSGKPCLLGRHEVTQAQWEALMGSNPSRFPGADRPVEGVSVAECLEFASRLSRTPAVQEAGLRFRLPTMAEWQLAAGGSAPPSRSELERIGWFAENSGGETHPVGEQEANALGCFDLYGNARELVLHPMEPTVWSLGGGPSAKIRGLPGMGGSCLSEAESSWRPTIVTHLGRELSSIPTEWIWLFLQIDLPAEAPDARTLALFETSFDEQPIGLRLCADAMQ